MTARPTFQVRRNQRANIRQADDLNQRLDKIVDRTTTAIALKAAEIVQKRKLMIKPTVDA